MTNPASTLEKLADEKLAEIAKKHLQVDSLAEQGSDRLDFVEVHVGNLKDALEAAMEAGFKAAQARYR